MSCERTEALTMAYLSGELTGAAVEQVERHLDNCPRCRQRHAEELDLLAALGDGTAGLAGAAFARQVMDDLAQLPLPGSEPPVEAEIRFFPWARRIWLPALAAAVALVIGIGSRPGWAADDLPAALAEQVGAAAQSWTDGAGALSHSWYLTAAAALSWGQSLVAQHSGAHETLIRIATATAAALCILLITACRPSLAGPNHELRS